MFPMDFNYCVFINTIGWLSPGCVALCLIVLNFYAMQQWNFVKLFLTFELMIG
jgi:hypothetical protein